MYVYIIYIHTDSYHPLNPNMGWIACQSKHVIYPPGLAMILIHMNTLNCVSEWSLKEFKGASYSSMPSQPIPIYS